MADIGDVWVSSTEMPKVPAVSRALKKIDGFSSEKISGGTRIAANLNAFNLCTPRFQGFGRRSAGVVS